MADDFSKAVEDGLRLSKRIYFGKDRSVAPPKPMAAMQVTPQSFLPASPMVYAAISDPSIVDNPDIPSYQPHVHGRCDPPALIPLQMNGIALEVDCFLNTTAFVTLTGSWRVHCVMGSARCDCRLAVPMGEQGSILGVEIEVPRKTYRTSLVAVDDKGEKENSAKAEDGGFLKSHIFYLTIPEVDGGSNLSLKVRWSQKLLYQDGHLTLNVPFSFPDYVAPSGKKLSKKEKIQLGVNSGPGTEVICKMTSHPLKELKRKAGKLGFLYESEVLSWSSGDFIFSYAVSASHVFGGVLLQAPSSFDIDQREMFSLYICPGNEQNRKVFRKQVIFTVDISGSMRGKPIEDTKNALIGVLSKLDQEDLFNVIAFNDETYLFSSSLEFATKESIENATQWISLNFIAGGGTNMLRPLNQAVEMLSDTQSYIPVVFFITDGAVEDEKHICEVLSGHLKDQGSLCPRVYTLGIGSFCNHYFLRMLATVGRGHHDSCYDTDSIEGQIEGLFSRASSTIIANLVIENLDDLDNFEVNPSPIPDLSLEEMIIVSGRYVGRFPASIKVRGLLADLSNFAVELEVQQAEAIPIDKVVAKQEIELYTAQAWFSKDRALVEKVSNISIHHGIVSEYTCMILLETVRGKQVPESAQVKHKPLDAKSEKAILLPHFGYGFGNMIATSENIPLGSNEAKGPEPAEMFVRAASDCCGKLCGRCCCMCCLQACSKVNDQCAIAITQLCGALACLGCVSCCELCCSGQA